MMKNTKQLSEAEQILKNREQQLADFPVGTLRSHGKLMGMDVFSWNKPEAYELENTLSSFPAPIAWFANEHDVLKLLKEDTSWVANVKFVCTYDKAGFKLPNKVLDSIDTVLGSASLDDALELLAPLSKKQGILLFTTSGENWKNAIQIFENYLTELRKA